MPNRYLATSGKRVNTNYMYILDIDSSWQNIQASRASKGNQLAEGSKQGTLHHRDD